MPPATIAAAASVAALSLILAPAAEPPKPAAAAPPGIEGTVRDPAGKPVEKARVMLRRTSGARPEALATASDASGRFALALLARGDYALRVEAKGWAPYALAHLAVPGPALSITLRKGAVIEGTVRDARGRPVPSARVEAREGRWAMRLPAAALDPDAGRVRATTDARGAFRLEGLAVAPHTVTASAATASARRNAVVPGTRVDLILTSGPGLRGLVVGPSDQPLANAVVVAEPDGPRTVSTIIERTDAAGRFEVSGLRAGGWRVLATHPDAAPAVASVALEPSAVKQVRLVLGPPAGARGRLVDAEGRAVRGAVVLQEIDGQPVAATLGETLRAESDEQGRFALSGLPRTSLSLRAEAQAFAARRIDAAPEGAELDLGDVMLEPGLSIRGRVRDDAGHPVADARVRATMMMAGRRSSLEATSGSDGTFVLAGAEPGFYRLEAEAAGYAGGNTRATPGADAADITVYRGGSITGTVVDEKGAAVPVFDVTAMPPEKEDGWTPALGEGSDGRFELTDVGPAVYVLMVKSADSAEAQVPRVTVRAGAATDVGRIRLSPGGIVRGRVTDAAGSPVAGASVWTEPARRALLMRSRGSTAATDPGGAFELRGVEAGPVDVVADHPDFAAGRAAGVDVDPARGPAEARITLTRGGRIEGVVRRREGRPVENARVQVAGGGPVVGLQWATVAPDGTFSVDRLAPGTVRVMVTVDATGQGSAVGTQRQVEVREGETTSLEFFLRETLVSGTVTRRGEPAAGARLMLRGRTMWMAFTPQMGGVVPPPAVGPQHGWAVTRADGGYELLVDEPGQYMALVTSADGGTNYPMRTIQVPDADAFTADLAFGGVPLSGRVVDAETGAPLGGATVAARAATSGGERPGPPATTLSARDGSFQLEVDPGAVTVGARADGYAAGRAAVTVGENGASDVRVALSRGLEIAGRVLDAAGKPVRAAFVSAEPEGEQAEGPGPNMGFAQSGADGTFTISGLAAGRFTLGTSDEAGGFAVLTGVAAGTQDALLRLAAGGEVRAQVFRPDGAPAPDVLVRIARVNGKPFWSGRPARTNASGVAELNAPAGAVELAASLDTATGSATVNVTAASTASVEIRLAPRRPGPGTP